MFWGFLYEERLSYYNFLYFRLYLQHYTTELRCLCAAKVPWGVAGSVAGLLPGAAVDRESPFAGVTAVSFPHTLFIQETNL